MTEKRTLSRWLRSEEVYRDESPASVDKNWREGLLAEFEYKLPAEPATVVIERRAPLQFHHLALMAPVGVVLFALGWIFGSGATALDQVARISPMAWAICAAASSGGFLLWRGRGLMAKR